MTIRQLPKSSKHTLQALCKQYTDTSRMQNLQPFALIKNSEPVLGYRYTILQDSDLPFDFEPQGALICFQTAFASYVLYFTDLNYFPNFQKLFLESLKIV